MTYQTTAAYLSGGICGPLWMGGLAGKPIQSNLRREMSRIVSDAPITFRDVVDLILSENGGDFQHARFTADTVIRVERRTRSDKGIYHVHVFEREIAQLPSLADLVNQDAFTGDFLDED